jgi:hypothetical protein
MATKQKLTLRGEIFAVVNATYKIQQKWTDPGSHPPQAILSVIVVSKTESRVPCTMR